MALGAPLVDTNVIGELARPRPNRGVRRWAEGVAGELRGRLRSRGLARSQADMLIAATAQLHGLTLVTRNVRAFEGTAIGLVNPFA